MQGTWKAFDDVALEGKGLLYVGISYSEKRIQISCVLDQGSKKNIWMYKRESNKMDKIT